MKNILHGSNLEDCSACWEFFFFFFLSVILKT